MRNNVKGGGSTNIWKKNEHTYAIRLMAFIKVTYQLPPEYRNDHMTESLKDARES